MTDDRRFKQVVRARMADTGESYMTARRRLLAARSPSPTNVLDREYPTVQRRFVEELISEIPAGLGSRVIAQPLEFDELPRSAAQQCVQFYSLLERGYRVWCAAAVRSTGRDAMLQGLLSVSRIFDADSASYNGAMLNEYRRSIEEDERVGGRPDSDVDARRILLCVEKACRVAWRSARVTGLDIPQRELLLGAHWCAAALAHAAQTGVIRDVGGEAGETVRAITR
jgi:hypothetical protein